MLKKINMFHLHIINHDVRFRASDGGDLTRFFNAYEACTMKKNICLIAATVLILSTTGCATSSCGNSGLFGTGLFSGGLFQGGLFENNPFSDGPIRRYFRGAPCSTCNPPSGQLGSYGSNVAPLCQDGNCGGHSPVSAPANIQLNDPGIPYYDSGNVVAPQSLVPSYGANVAPQGNIIPQGNIVPQGSSNRVTYGVDDLPSIDAFSNSIDADAFPPTP